MMLRTDMEHLPWPMRHELRSIAAMVFESLAQATKGKLSDKHRHGRIIKLILHGPHTHSESQDLLAGEAIHLLAIVNHPRLAGAQQNWRLIRDRLRRAWESNSTRKWRWPIPIPGPCFISR